MQGRCKYCGKELKNKSNIRCEICNQAFQDGETLGQEIITEKVGFAVRLLLNLAELKEEIK